MKRVLHFNQGPMFGKNVEVDTDEATIQSLLDTGYCTEVPEPPKAVELEEEPEPEKPKKSTKRTSAKKKPAAKKSGGKRKKRKMETPEA